MPVVRIPDPVFERLQAIATPFVDTPATVIERLLEFYEHHQVTPSPQRPVTRVDGRPFDPETPPDLLYTRILSAEFGGHPASNWNELMVVAHRVAMARLKSVDALRSATLANVVTGRRADSGFHFQQDMNVSIQNVDANHAWRNSLHLARRLGTTIRVALEWRSKKGAARPGEQGTLEWTPSKSGGEAS